MSVGVDNGLCRCRSCQVADTFDALVTVGIVLPTGGRPVFRYLLVVV